jgi:hypothetical protein
MPTNPAKARILLKSGRARVVKKEPFTIQLLYATTDCVQDLTMGIDPGSTTAGLAVVEPSKGTVKYSSEVTLRQDVTQNMDERKMYRRNRRNRKTRYRKPRFLNRGNSTKNDRISPTLVSKIQAHTREIELICSILPVSEIVYEKFAFDMHAIVNPEVLTNKALYQKGPQYGYENTKAAVR